MAARQRDAEEQARKKVVRHRFCSLMRRVSYNRLWLVDAVEQKMTLNVHKNIGNFVREHRKLGILTLPEKSMLHTDPSFRTIPTRKHLTNVFLGLSCFSAIPPVLRARLVNVMTFMYVGAGRTVIREGHNPMAIYFILTGQVEMQKRFFDPLSGAYVDKTVFIFGPGDMIGESEMIERTRRRNSFVTATETQFLAILEDEFDEILRPMMAKRWFDKKEALYRLGYFEFFTEEQILTACKLGILKQFEPLDTIFAEDKGHLTYVHFVTSGECMILQCLKIKAVISKTGKKTYELVDASKAKAASIFHEVSQSELMSLAGRTHEEDDTKTFIDKLLKEEEKTYAKKTKQDSETVLKRVEKMCLLRAQYSTENLQFTRSFDNFDKFDDSDLDIEEEVEAEPEYESESGSSSILTYDDISEGAESMDPYEKMQRRNIDYYDEEMALWRKLRKLDTDKKLAKGPKFKQDDARFAREKKEEERRQKELEKEIAKEKRRERNAIRKERFLRALEAKQRAKSAASKKQRAFGKQESQGEDAEKHEAQQQDANEQNADKQDDKKQNAKEGDKEQRTEENTEQLHTDVGNVKTRLSQGAKDKYQIIKKGPEEKKKKQADVQFDESSVPPADPITATKQKKDYIHNHFVDVGSLTFGGIFGLGEHMEHRVIMARTSVQCLTLPRFWLLTKKQNPGNIWNRRRYTLDISIPSREKLYKNFKTSLTWESYKKRFVQSVLGPCLHNPTKTEDVPVMCRILEGESKKGSKNMYKNYK